MTEPQEDTQRFTLMANRNLLSVIMLGAVIGGLCWGLTAALGIYAFPSFFCDDGSQCASAAGYARITAVIITAIVALLGLVRPGIFRPLLAVIAVCASLWGVEELVSVFPWYVALPVVMGLYAAAYGLYVWIVRVRVFWLAATLSVLLIVAVRWTMVS